MHIKTLTAFAAFSAGVLANDDAANFASSCSAINTQIASAMGTMGSGQPDMSAIQDSLAKMGQDCGPAPDAGNMMAYMQTQIMQLSMKMAAMEMAKGDSANAMAGVCAASAMAQPMPACQQACSTNSGSSNGGSGFYGGSNGGNQGRNGGWEHGSVTTLPPPVTSAPTTAKTTVPHPQPAHSGSCCSGPVSDLNACEATCKTSYSSCQTAPNANEAQCAADYASCLGYSPFPFGKDSTEQTGCASLQTHTTSATPKPTSKGSCCSGPESKLAACESSCKKSYSACQTAPNANQAQCAADYSSCLGYSPFSFGKEGTVQTGCASSQTQTTTSVAPHTTSVGGSCCALPPARQPYCKAVCEQKHEVCSAAPNANQAQCASEYVSCLGYNPYPFGPSGIVQTGCGATATQTPIPSGTAGCSAKRVECQNKPNANEAQCVAEYASCTSVPSSTTSAATTSSANSCSNKRTECQEKPNANEARCAAEFAECTGGAISTTSCETSTTEKSTLTTTTKPSVYSTTTASVYSTTTPASSSATGWGNGW